MLAIPVVCLSVYFALPIFHASSACSLELGQCPSRMLADSGSFCQLLSGGGIVVFPPCSL